MLICTSASLQFAAYIISSAAIQNCTERNHAQEFKRACRISSYVTKEYREFQVLSILDKSSASFKTHDNPMRSEARVAKHDAICICNLNHLPFKTR